MREPCFHIVRYMVLGQNLTTILCEILLIHIVRMFRACLLHALTVYLTSGWATILVVFAGIFFVSVSPSPKNHLTQH